MKFLCSQEFILVLMLWMYKVTGFCNHTVKARIHLHLLLQLLLF